MFTARRAAELSTAGSKLLFILWNCAALLLSSAVISTLCLLLGLGMMDIQLFFDYFRRPLLFLLNWLPLLVCQLLFLCLFNRQALAFSATAALFFSAAAGDFYKLRLRSEPFLFSDIGLIPTALRVSGSYDLRPNLRIFFGLGLILLIALFLLLLARGRLPRRSRQGLALVLLLALYPGWRLVYHSDALYYDSEATDSPHVVHGWTQQYQVSKGFVYSFLHSIRDTAKRPPAGYSEASVEAALSTVKDADIPADRRVNLLVFQLEAFCDLNSLGLTGISPDVYADFERLRAESLSGTLIANVFAGGTVDTERCFLTGSSCLHDYRAAADSYVWYLARQDYVTVGSHPNYKAFYNRQNVNRYLGFSDYWYLDDHYQTMLAPLPNPWLSDNLVIPEVTRQFLELTRSGRSVFSFNVTMQGHSPYPTDHYVFGDGYWSGKGYSDTARYVLNNYLGSVAQTSHALWETAQRMQREDIPVVMLLYGDHKPWLGNDNAVYHELGIDLLLSSERGIINYYATPYLLWANDAARKQLGNDFSGEGPTVSPGFLMKLLFDQLGWQGDAYMQLSNRLYRQSSVMHSGGFYLENGKLSSVSSPETSKALQELRNLEYYRAQHFSPPTVPWSS